MVCPYAKQIRGSIAFCQLIRKKVSTLRYPCKGNYKRCPIYLRYGARAAPPPRPRPEERPRAEAKPPEEAVKPTVREERPAPPIKAEEAKREPAPTAPPSTRSGGPGVLKPSEALCDSLVLAGLTVAAKPLGIARGKLEDVVENARQYLDKESFVFILGDIAGYRMRILFAGNHATYSFEKAGTPICGSEAEQILGKVRGEEFNGIYYRVKLEDVPLWRDSILKELGVS
ncbi:MAG: hypothetical protein F7C33_05165 [Desulfurococcales archaeon]|nr:hypothetical protein [Desulfurococcales archaeon]